MNPATDKEHYYIRSSNSRWVEAPDDVKNALKNPCAFKHPPPNSKCQPGEYENAPIQFEDAMINTVDNDFTANVITRNRINRIVLGTDDRGADDVEEYNKNWAKKQEKNAEKRLNELTGNRMNEEGGRDMVLRQIPKKTALAPWSQAYVNHMHDGLGGAKNKKKHRFRTKRRRRSASRRKAPRRRTGKK